MIKQKKLLLIKALGLVEEIATKHVQHDQSTHGRGRSGGGGAFSGKPANPDGNDTFEQYRDSEGNWTKERQAMHDEIIKRHLAKATPVDNPESFMMGGGPASGKSMLLKTGKAKVPKNHITIDPDEMKKELPEYNQMKKDKNPAAAAFAHEESSYLSKRLMAEAAAQKYNVMLDGTGDSSYDKVVKKVGQLRSSGAPVKANYVTVDTETAVERNRVRAEKTGRLVPEEFVRDAHKQVSKVVPQAIKDGLFDELNVFDTNTSGQAIAVASAKGSDLTIHNQELWDRFVAKGSE